MSTIDLASSQTNLYARNGGISNGPVHTWTTGLNFDLTRDSIKADMPIGVSHRQVNQYPIGSRNSAIHNAYHSSLRPSSFYEPKHPSLIQLYYTNETNYNMVDTAAAQK